MRIKHGGNEKCQIIVLQKSGMSENCISMQKQTRKDFHRANYEKMILKFRESAREY